MTHGLHDKLPLARWDAFDRFLERCYGPGYALRNKALTRWQFSLADDPDALSILWFGDENEVISILGCRPTPMAWDGRPITGGWLMNWITDPAHRSGIGAILMRRAQELYPVVVAQGASASNRPIAERLGFRIVEPIPRLVAVFDSARTAKFLAEGELPPSVTPRAAEVTEGLPEDFAPDWRKYPEPMRFGALRDRAFLTWRYTEHPAFDYRILRIGSAVCVYRIEETRGEVVDRVGRIVELFHADGAAGEGEAVLSAALHRMRQAGAAFADFFCSARVYRETAAAAGMADATWAALAARLSPVDRRLRLQNLEFWADSALARPPELDLWYVTKADGDQDRPNTV